MIEVERYIHTTGVENRERDGLGVSAARNAAIYGKNAFQEVPESLTLYRRWENNASKNFMRFAERQQRTVGHALA